MRIFTICCYFLLYLVILSSCSTCVFDYNVINVFMFSLFCCLQDRSIKSQLDPNVFLSKKYSRRKIFGRRLLSFVGREYFVCGGGTWGILSQSDYFARFVLTAPLAYTSLTLLARLSNWLLSSFCFSFHAPSPEICHHQ